MKKPKHWLAILTHVAALTPLAVMAWEYARGQLSVDPIREITLRTGKAALVLLVLSLAVTPVHILFGTRLVLKLRRPLGLYAFLYASLHGLTFVGLDYGFNLGLLLREVLQKRFVQAGILAFLLLLPLAITSTRGWMSRLGRNWKRLHRLVYVAALVAVVHFVWLAKGDIREPLAYGAVVVLLLAVRLPFVRSAIREKKVDGSR
jgi:sulfoxide reductase heme-binding subunit YedZ